MPLAALSKAFLDQLKVESGQLTRKQLQLFQFNKFCFTSASSVPTTFPGAVGNITNRKTWEYSNQYNKHFLDKSMGVNESICNRYLGEWREKVVMKE